MPLRLAYPARSARLRFLCTYLYICSSLFFSRSVVFAPGPSSFGQIDFIFLQSIVFVPTVVCLARLHFPSPFSHFGCFIIFSLLPFQRGSSPFSHFGCFIIFSLLPFQRGFSGWFSRFFHLGLDDSEKERERELEREKERARDPR